MPLILDLFSQFPRSPIRPDWLGRRLLRDIGLEDPFCAPRLRPDLLGEFRP